MPTRSFRVSAANGSCRRQKIPRGATASALCSRPLRKSPEPFGPAATLCGHRVLSPGSPAVLGELTLISWKEHCRSRNSPPGGWAPAWRHPLASRWGPRCSSEGVRSPSDRQCRSGPGGAAPYPTPGNEVSSLFAGGGGPLPKSCQQSAISQNLSEPTADG